MVLIFFVEGGGTMINCYKSRHYVADCKSIIHMQVVCKERGLGMGLLGYKRQAEIMPTRIMAPEFDHCPAQELDGHLVFMKSVSEFG